MKLKKFLFMLPVFCVIACIAGILTFVLTALKEGFGDTFLLSWIKAFIPVAFLIAPLGIVSTFVLDKVVNFLFKKVKPLGKKIILAIMMGCTIEFFVSLITMLISQNFTNFLSNWIHLYLKSLPLGFVVGLTMSFIVKPWMGARVEKMKNLK